MQGCPFKAVIEQSSDVIAQLDRTSRHLYVNTAMRLYGIEPEQARGKTWEELGVPTKVRNRWMKCLEQVFQTGEQYAFESGVPMPEKEPVYLCVRLLPEFAADGSVESVIYVARDITQTVLSEQKYAAHIEKMDQEIARLGGLNLVGRLAASIGHELRNPMTTVRGFLQLLNNQESDAKRQGFFKIMIEELDRANTIISEYLSLAKEKPTELKKASLNVIIEKLHPLMQGAAFQCNREILCLLGDDVPAMLAEHEIRQLILNLVKNGLEATPVHGCVTIKTYHDGDRLVLQIQDEGGGMPVQVLEKIGTPFFTTKANGTGLGLTVCYSIAKRHQAAIDVQSNAAGTTFCVRFPVL